MLTPLPWQERGWGRTMPIFQYNGPTNRSCRNIRHTRRNQPAVSTARPLDTADQAAAAPRASRFGLAWPWLALAAIVLGGLALRVATARISLPFVDHPDEPNPIDYVVQMLRSGDPNPHAFQKPSLYVYLLLAVLSAHYQRGLAAGAYGPIDQMLVTTHLYTTVPGFFLWGRMLTATIAAATLACAFLLGRRELSLGAGLVAALFLALSPFHLRHSQFVTTDVASGWLVLLAFGAALAVARAGRTRDYLAAGVFAGLAASTKYNAGVAALMVLAAHLLAARGLWLRRLHLLALAGLAAMLGFVAGTPYALLSWPEFQAGLLGQLRDYSETAHGDWVGAWNLRGYLAFFLDDGLGWAGCLALPIGLALLLRRQRAVALIWLSFALPYLLLHLAQQSHFARNMLPVTVLAALPIGVAVVAAGELAWPLAGSQKQAGTHALGDEGPRTKDQARSVVRAWPIVPGIALVLLMLGPALISWQHTQRLARGDTRVQALAWVEANVPPGVRVAAELRPLPGDGESRWADARGLLRHDLAWYRRQGYAYLIASSDSWKQWEVPAAYQAFAGRPPLAEFGGATARSMLGPHLLVYASGLAPADAPEPPAAPAQVGGAHLAGVAIGRPDPDSPWLGIAPARELKAGEALALRTFWSVQQPFDRDYFVFVHILDAAGQIVAQRDAPPWQGRFGTASWRPGSLVVDINDLVLPAGLPPGQYRLVAGMFDPASGARPATTVGGQPNGEVPIGEIIITP